MKTHVVASEIPPVDVHTLGLILGISVRQIQRLVKLGVIPKCARGRCDLPAAVQAWVTYTGDGKTPGVLVDDRRRLVAAQARRAELANQQNAGELLLASDVQLVLNETAATVVQSLEALPGRLAGVLSGQTDPAVIRGLIQAEVRAIRSEMTRRFQQLSGQPPAKIARKR